MRITDEEKQEIIDMWMSGKFYNVEIAKWMGISISSIRKIIKEYYDANKKEINKL